MTKSFTVTVILQLVRDRVITLDDKLDKFIPGIPNGALVTLADLAGMTSGIADYSATTEYGDILNHDIGHVFTEDELVALAIRYSPKFSPGAAYEYSNTNTLLLGMIVEKVSGLSLGKALEARILGPLALSQTTYPVCHAAAGPASHALRSEHRHRRFRGAAAFESHRLLPAPGRWSRRWTTCRRGGARWATAA